MADFEHSREMDASPDAVWRLVSDPHRLADWVPTTTASDPAGEDAVHLKGESHGHDYDARGGFTVDNDARRLSWDSPRYTGYRGVLTVAERGSGSLVTVRVTIPRVPAEASAEMTQGIEDALARIDQLATT